MTTYFGYDAAQRDRATTVERLVEIVTEPGVVLLAVLAVFSFAIGIALPDIGVQLGQLF